MHFRQVLLYNANLQSHRAKKKIQKKSLVHAALYDTEP